MVIQLTGFWVSECQGFTLRPCDKVFNPLCFKVLCSTALSCLSDKQREAHSSNKWKRLTIKQQYCNSSIFKEPRQVVKHVPDLKRSSDKDNSCGFLTSAVSICYFFYVNFSKIWKIIVFQSLVPTVTPSHTPMSSNFLSRSSISFPGRHIAAVLLFLWKHF